jgi:type III secretory pathway component EscS
MFSSLFLKKDYILQKKKKILACGLLVVEIADMIGLLVDLVKIITDISIEV